MAEKFVQADPIKLWTESFGDPKNPAMLLIMGAGAQGIFWPDRLCKLLADNGFFVIRYDNRDCGKSSAVHSLTISYTLDDMADDAIAILDAYGIDKAHIVGASMGGTIAQLLALNHPERVLSLILIMSTPDLSVVAYAINLPVLRTLMGFTKRSDLPPPTDEVISFFRSVILTPPQTREGWSDVGEKAWAVFSNGVPFDEQEIKELEQKAFERTESPHALLGHARAILNSAKKEIDLSAISQPTLIIHGEHDPIFPVEHGKALAEVVPNAQLEILPDMAHVIPTALSKKLTDIIVWHTKNR